MGEMEAVAKSIVNNVPKWTGSNLKPILDQTYGNSPVYQQWKPFIHPLVDYLVSFDWSTIITMIENQQYLAAFQKYFDHAYDYIIAQSKLDHHVPAAYQPVFQEFKA